MHQKQFELTAHGNTVIVRHVRAANPSPARWEITHNGKYIFSMPTKGGARRIALAHLEKVKDNAD